MRPSLTVTTTTISGVRAVALVQDGQEVESASAGSEVEQFRPHTFLCRDGRPGW